VDANREAIPAPRRSAGVEPHRQQAAINHGREIAEAIDRDGYRNRPEQEELEDLRREYAPRRRPAREESDESFDPVHALLFYPIPMPLVWAGLVACYCIAAACGVVW